MHDRENVMIMQSFVVVVLHSRLGGNDQGGGGGRGQVGGVAEKKATIEVLI